MPTISDLLARIRAHHLLRGIRRSLLNLTDQELSQYLNELERGDYPGGQNVKRNDH